jgi:16S rRNA (adenine1518-N6/adenine1519-N6)-dimethyltransferase
MDAQEVLRQLQARAKKRFGQNFLVDPAVLGDIVEAANLSDRDTVVEIGPGLGTLTFELAKRAKRVIAIEADHDLVDYLR